MPNQYFQFKEFRIEQGDGGMKVSTDACIQGAWVYQLLKGDALSVLDIGAGTGLLSLMLCQSNAIEGVTAIEIEAAAAKQCQKNFNNSLWSDRLAILHQSLQDFINVNTSRFDIIISNPPFFENQLKSTDDKRSLAFHDDALTKRELASAIAHALHPDGVAYVLYPTSEWDIFEKVLGAYGLSVNKELRIFPSTKKTYNRVVGEIVVAATAPTEIHELYIRDASNEYSKSFTELLRPFYLNL